MSDSISIQNQTPKDKPVVITAEGFSKKNSFKFSFVNPKILSAMTVLLLMIGGIGTAVYLTQKPQQISSLASVTMVDLVFQPSQVSTQAGKNFTLDVFANSKDVKITGVNLTFNYDSQFLQLKSITPKQFLPKILVEPKISSGSASISLGPAGSEGITGNGILASLVFKAIKPTDSLPTEISIDETQSQINTLDQAQIKTNFGTAKITALPGTNVNDTQPASTSAQINIPPTQTASGSGLTNTSDFNSDSLVNSVDLSIMYSGWGNPKTEVQKKADLNGDGIINGIDYSLMLPKFKK